MQVSALHLHSGAPMPQPDTGTPMVVCGVPAFHPEQTASVAIYQDLLAAAQQYASPQVSGRRVGAIAIGHSGTAYLGANIEIKGASPSDTIHAEAFAITLARHYGESGIASMVQTLQPCGSCRQIMAEVGSPDLTVFILDRPDQIQQETIGTLFPMGYTYASEGLNLFRHPTLTLDASLLGECVLLKQAFTKASRCYLPNPSRKSWCGLAAQLKNGKIYTGSAISISGPNPTITPVQDLLIQLIAHGESPEDIVTAHIIEPCEPDYSFFRNTEAVLEKIAPCATIHRTQA